MSGRTTQAAQAAPAAEMQGGTLPPRTQLLSGQVISAPGEARTTERPMLEGPKVLAVVAHPDDEAYFSASLYRIARDFGGKVDLVVISNGEAGFNYSAFGAQVNGKDLSTESKARAQLPDIREKEQRQGGDILGVRDYTFLHQKDEKVPTERVVLESGMWDAERVKREVSAKLTKGGYDYVFTLLPKEDEHSGHKAATILALDAVQSLPEGKRPTVLGASLAETCGPNPNSYYGKSPDEFRVLEGYPQTETRNDLPGLGFDRTQHFGCNNKLSYQIIANAHIASHLSQGASQEFAWKGGCEKFFVYSSNSAAQTLAAEKLIAQLNEMPNIPCVVPPTPAK